MGDLFAYSLSSSLVLTLLYLIYKWVLASENFHSLNRGLLWTIYIVSLTAVPAYAMVNRLLSSSGPANIAINLEGISNTLVVAPATHPNPLPSIILWVYFIGMGVAAVLTAINFIRIYRIIRRGRREEITGQKVILTSTKGIAPFSFGTYIVIPENETPENISMILLHEKSHIALHHWLDLLFAQAICIFQWYNPTAWLMREEFKTIHEYQADRRVITSVANIRDYQLLLIRKAVGARFPSLANSLNHSKRKKRILMMCKQNSSRASRILRPLILVPVLGVAVWLTRLPVVASVIDSFTASSLTLPGLSKDKVTKFPAEKATNEAGKSTETVATPSPTSSQEKTTVATPDVKENESEPAIAVDKTAEFPGGMQALFSYLASHIQAPNDDTPTGRVIVRFVVEANGEIGPAEIVKGLSPSMDAEALRVVRSMPKWIPAEVDGHSVASKYVLPVSYIAEGENTHLFVLPDGSNSNEKGAPLKSSSTSTSTTTSTTSSSSNVMTSVSTSTNSSGKKETKTVISINDGENNNMSVSITSDKKEGADYEVFVNGKKYDGNLNDIPSAKVESMRVDKTDDSKAKIYITLKK